MIRRVLIVFLIVTVTLSSGCHSRRLIIEEQIDYHDSISELEQYILDDYGYCILFEDPTIDYSNKIITINLTFLTSNIYKSKADKTVVLSMDNIRIAVNTFLRENPNYFLNDDYYIRLFFYEAPYYRSGHYEELGSITNHLSDADTNETYLCNVCYDLSYCDIHSEGLSFDDIVEIDIRNQGDADYISQFLEAMPDLEIICTNPDSVEYYSEAFPGIDVING